MRDVLAAFVDRQAELGRFCEMLENDEKPIMIVWGDVGIGKSSLLARLIHECALRKLRRAEVFASKNRFNSYLEILRKIRDDLGPELFPNFTQLVNVFFPDPLHPRAPVRSISRAERKACSNARGWKTSPSTAMTPPSSSRIA